MKTSNKPLLNKLYKILLNKKILIFSFVSTAILTLVLNRIEHIIAGSGGVSYSMLQLAFTKNNFEMIIASWGSEGINLYIKSMWIDLLYIISYTSLFLSAPVYFHNLRNQKFSIDENYNTKLFFLPFLTFSFDLFENVMHLIIITQRLFTEELIFISSIASSMKWLLIISCLAIVLMKYFEMRKK